MRVFFDLDGTLCHTPDDISHDDVEDLVARCRPSREALQRVEDLVAAGHEVGIVTGRSPVVAAATSLQLIEWLGQLGAAMPVHHRAQAVWDFARYVPDKVASLQLERAEVYVGDRIEDQRSAELAGARFVWAHDFAAAGLPTAILQPREALA